MTTEPSPYPLAVEGEIDAFPGTRERRLYDVVVIGGGQARLLMVRCCQSHAHARSRVVAFADRRVTHREAPTAWTGDYDVRGSRAPA